VGEHKAATKTLAVLADPVFERTGERFKLPTAQSPGATKVFGAQADGTRGLSLVVAKSAKESGIAGKARRYRG
jgi:hypothetical protein